MRGHLALRVQAATGIPRRDPAGHPGSEGENPGHQGLVSQVRGRGQGRQRHVLRPAGRHQGRPGGGLGQPGPDRRHGGIQQGLRQTAGRRAERGNPAARGPPGQEALHHGHRLPGPSERCEDAVLHGAGSGLRILHLQGG